jgi:hypothetical protein
MPSEPLLCPPALPRSVPSRRFRRTHPVSYGDVLASAKAQNHVRRAPIRCLASPNDFIQRKIQLLINNNEGPFGASHRCRDDPLHEIHAAIHPNAEQALSSRSCGRANILGCQIAHS